MRRLCFLAVAAMASSSVALREIPVGFEGEFMMRSFDFGVMWASMRWGVSLKSG